MKLFRPGFPGRCLYPEALFRMETSEKNLFLTFDDGPYPSSTPLLLKTLRENNVKALFFLNGRAAENNPLLVDQIIKDGHLVGNHGYSHLNGWHTDFTSYINDVSRAAEVIPGNLFRPPFGHMSLRQYSHLKGVFKIVLWDVMSYDFDISFGPEKSLMILKKKIRPGSIIVLHDTPYSSAILFLKKFILYAVESGYKFDLINI